MQFQDGDFEIAGAFFCPCFLIVKLPLCSIFVNWNVNMVTIYKVLTFSGVR